MEHPNTPNTPRLIHLIHPNTPRQLLVYGAERDLHDLALAPDVDRLLGSVTCVYLREGVRKLRVRVSKLGNSIHYIL